MSDLIDQLAGIAPGSPLDTARANRVEARSQAQASYAALFEPAAASSLSLTERFAVGAFVTGLHNQPETAAHYAGELARHAPPALVAEVAAAIRAAQASGPYGAYPPGPLSGENAEGPVFRPANGAALGPRLAVAFVHAHMLVFHPRDAAPEHLQALLDAGFTTTEVVTISQIVSFLAFQIRVVSGLRTLAAAL